MPVAADLVAVQDSPIVMIMRNVSIVAAGLLLAATSHQPTAAEVGPEPVFSDAVVAIEQTVRARLADPDSAQFEWPYGFAPGAITPPFGHRHVGWITCGLLNARNRSGRYNGLSYFQVVVRDGSIDMLNIGTGDNYDTTGPSCQQLIKDNFLRAPSTVPASAARPGPQPSNAPR